MKREEILEFAKRKGYANIKYLSKWRGYDAYDPIYDEDFVAYIGPPLLILVKDGEIRMSDEQEAFDYLDCFQDGNEP